MSSMCKGGNVGWQPVFPDVAGMHLRLLNLKGNSICMVNMILPWFILCFILYQLRVRKGKPTEGPEFRTWPCLSANARFNWYHFSICNRT